MWPADQDLQERFGHAENAALIKYLQVRAPTAADELVAETMLATGEFGDGENGGALSYSPDAAGNAYHLLYAPSGIVYGVTEDEGRLVLRLPNEMEPPALGDAAFIAALLSDATRRFWAAFPVFAEDTIDRDQDETRAILKKWVERSREFAES